MIIGILAATYVLYNSITEVHFEHSISGSFNLVEGLSLDEVDHKDPANFEIVEEGNGAFDKVTYRDTLNNINWTWLTIFWLFACMYLRCN